MMVRPFVAIFSIAPKRKPFAASIFISIFFSSLTSGCRLGNHVEPWTDPDQTSGLYQTVPSGYSQCITARNTYCGDRPSAEIPSWASSILTQPTRVLLEDVDAKEITLSSPYASNSGKLPLILDQVNSSTMSFYQLMNTRLTPFWREQTDCTMRLYLEIDGSLTRHESTLNVGTRVVHTVGNIGAHIKAVRSIDGPGCPEILKTMLACSQDVTQCQGEGPRQNEELQTTAKAFFSTFSGIPGVPSDALGSLSLISYDIHYSPPNP